MIRKKFHKFILLGSWVRVSFASLWSIILWYCIFCLKNLLGPRFSGCFSLDLKWSLIGSQLTTFFIQNDDRYLAKWHHLSENFMDLNNKSCFCCYQLDNITTTHNCMTCVMSTTKFCHNFVKMSSLSNKLSWQMQFAKIVWKIVWIILKKKNAHQNCRTRLSFFLSIYWISQITNKKMPWCSKMKASL